MDYEKEYIAKNPSLHKEHSIEKAHQIIKVVEGSSYENKRILDVACGAGVITLLLADKIKPKYIEGIDISSSMIEAAKKSDKENKVVWNVVDIFDYKPDEVFDLIVCADIIEHINDDDRFIAKISEMSREFVIRVPLEDSLFVRVIRALKICDPWKDTEKRYGHMHHYSESQLRDMFKRHSLAVKSSFSVPMPKRSKPVWEFFRLLFFPIALISMDLMVKISGGFKLFHLKKI